ncbi:MAG: hypothetical protein CVT89_00335, partial [Candidatus Altiarchaeales archaeon HGW-Altiarchaeales-2]
MDKNLLKIGSLIFVVVVVVVLLIYGNQNAPAIIEKGNLKLVYFTPWTLSINYKSISKNIYEEKSNKSLFNENDTKEVKVDGNKMIITYRNESKDPNRVDIVFTLTNNTVTLNIIPNVTYKEELKGLTYAYYFRDMGYNKIITPSEDLIKNEGNEIYSWKGGIQIPEIDKNYQLVFSNTSMLNISGNFSQITNSMKSQVSWFYVNPNETLTIKVQELMELNLTDKGLSLRNEGEYVRLYNMSK